MYTHDSFTTLNFEQQIVIVWDEGRHIATRYEEEDAVGLYRMAGNFFVELYYDQPANKMVETISTFTDNDSDKLEDYASYISLNDLGQL